MVYHKLGLHTGRFCAIIRHLKREEGSEMKFISYLEYGDVDDLIFVNETWSKSER